MPRKARIAAPGIMLHIMAHSIEGCDLFIDDDDRNTFLSFFRKGLQQTNYRCYAWVLMSNHYHLLLRTSDQHPAVLMRKINSWYAGYYNRKYRRRGYLFEDRYKSIATQDQNYIGEIVRYIHLNPVRAGICKALQELEYYPWSGHAAVCGTIPNDFQDIVPVLRRFGKTDLQSRKNLRWFLAEGLKTTATGTVIETIRKSNTGACDIHQTGCWVIGDQAFVKSVIDADREHRLRISEYSKNGITMDVIARKVAEYYNITVAQLLKRSRLTVVAEARKVFAYGCRTYLDYPVNAIGTYLGMTGPSASTCIKKGEALFTNPDTVNLFLNLRP